MHMLSSCTLSETQTRLLKEYGRLQVLYGVKPDQKKMFISRLQEDQNIVAMVGDGINDAAALASSHVGVAIGGGVGAASEVSSIVLMHNKLSQVCWPATSLSHYILKFMVSEFCSNHVLLDRVIK